MQGLGVDCVHWDEVLKSLDQGLGVGCVHWDEVSGSGMGCWKARVPQEFVSSSCAVI